MLNEWNHKYCSSTLNKKLFVNKIDLFHFPKLGAQCFHIFSYDLYS